MSFLKNKLATMVIVTVLALPLVQCSSGSSAISTSSSGTVSSASGILKAADGSAIAGATVALATSSASSLKKYLSNEHGKWLNLPQLEDSDGDTCDDLGIAETDLLSYDCTGANGSYTFTGEIPCGTSVTFYAKKGSFSISATLTFTCTDSNGDGDNDDIDADDIELSDDCGAGEDDDSEAASLVNGKPAFSLANCSAELADIAVVTGTWDSMENLIGKLLDSPAVVDGVLDTTADPDTFGFTLIDGDYTLDDSTFDNFDDFVSDVDNLNAYDIIFINCGSSYEDLSTDSAVQSVLQEYVNGGGKLYVTDWSYMFIEQNFPDFMDYLDGGDDSDTAESPITAAKSGDSGISVDATINDEDMADWLDGVYVNPNTTENGPGDPNDCYSYDYSSWYSLNLSEADSTVIEATWPGALNDDGTVTIGDFLSAWVVMSEIHEDIVGTEDEPTVWIEGDITHYSGSIVDAPLTVSRDQGDGRILYSSYHTAHSCPTSGYWPQERILQYLVWEL